MRTRAMPDSGARLDRPTRRGRSWTWLWCLSTAAGFGTYLAFASEQADRDNAGEVVPGWVTAGVAIGGVLLLAGLAALLLDGIHRGREEGRPIQQIARRIGLGVFSMVAGFIVMLIAVRAAFG